MFLSLAVDRDSHSATFRFLDRPDVFNVAITRARSLQIVFASIDPEDLAGDSLLRRYLEEIQTPPKAPSPESASSDDAFLQSVRTEMAERGFNTWPAYPLAGLHIDLVVEKDRRSLGIDLVGYPGRFALAFDLEKYRMLQRAGMRLFPLPYSAWTKRKDECIEAIQAWMTQA